MLHARLADGTPLASNPKVIRALLAAAREINPAATVVPAAGADALKTLDDELAGLEQMMGDRRSEYWKGAKAETLQARYRTLVDAKTKTGQRAR